MIVYFSTNAREVKKNLATYRVIFETIYKQGHALANAWVEHVLQRETVGIYDFPEINALVSEALSGIDRSDILIAEASGASAFGVGFEVAVAVQQRKPVLLLVHEKWAKSSYAAGLKGKMLTYKSYNEDNLQRTVQRFIKEHAVQSKDLRFNFVIDSQIFNYLRARSYESGKTKAELVRELLIKDMKSE